MQSDINTEISSPKRLVQLFAKPIDQVVADKIIAQSSVSTVYYTRICCEEEQEIKLTKINEPLFSYVIDDDSSTLENKSTVSDSNHIYIGPDFHDFDDSNIVQEGKNYVASIDGLFVLDFERPKIIPISLDGSADVKVSEDSMFVHLDLYPSVGDHPIPSVDDIVQKIRNLGVTAEINQSLIEAKLEEVKVTKNKIFDIFVAQGKPPINGEDGRLENCTDKNETLKNFEFHEFYKVNPVISVKNGETIAIIHPPTEGESGLNVFNKVIEPIPGKKYMIKLGKNTLYSEENETHIIAKLDGFVDLTESSIEVTDTFTVRGDIDFKSGNIFSKGSLKVTGNVNNEFKLNLTKDIEIGGYVGDAIIESGQNIMIKGGFLGKGKGMIKAEGDIEVKFVENQTVFTRGSLILVKEALNAKLFVKNRISTKSNAVIVGGHTIAGDSIQVYSIGNSSEAETIVEVGFDYLKRNSIETNKDKQVSLRQTLEEVDKQLLEFAQMKRLNDKYREKVKLLANEHKRLVAEIEALKAEILKITNEIYIPTSSKISVTGTVYPGAKIGINGRFLIVKEPYRSRTFVLSKDNEVIAV